MCVSVCIPREEGTQREREGKKARGRYAEKGGRGRGERGREILL